MTHPAPAAAGSTGGSPRHAVPGPLLGVAVAVLVVTTALTLYGAHGRYEVPLVLTAVVLSVVGVYGFLVPRTLAAGRAGTVALVLSVLAVLLLLPAFWSGQSLILGAAAVLLGLAGRRAAQGAGRSIVAVVLGLVAGTGYFAIYLLDALLPAGGA